MAAKHPLLHPNLSNFSIFCSFENLISTNEKTIVFLEEVGLIPNKTSTPPSCCSIPMKVENNTNCKLGWVWRCSAKSSKKKGDRTCRKSINPSIGTFFHGSQCRLEIREVLAIVISFVIKIPVNTVFQNLLAWRHHDTKNELSKSTVIDYYNYCREIAEIIASHHDITIGGEGKTVQIDETFLTKRKYHRGRITEQMTIVVLGLYCKEDKIGLFFKVNSKCKADLWPYIHKYVNQSTSRICTDSARQYIGIEKIFPGSTVHNTTNHSKGEYVNENDHTNTINDLENQNRILKKNLLCRRTTNHLHQYMALFFYRKHCLEKKYKEDTGSQIMEFLMDMKKVYPCIADGAECVGLQLKDFDPPTVESENLEAVIPPKQPRLLTINDELNELYELDTNENTDDDFMDENNINF